MTTLAPPRAAPEKRAPFVPADVPAAAPSPKLTGVGDPGHPQATPWRLDLLADDGTVRQVKVPDTLLTTWDTVEALVTSALTGVRHHPAGRTHRTVGRPPRPRGGA